MSRARTLTETARCGHEARTAVGEPLDCCLPYGHKGLHEQRDKLRDGTIVRTNWGSDGLAPWTTRDVAR